MTEKQLIKLFWLAKKVKRYELKIQVHSDEIRVIGTNLDNSYMEYCYIDILEQLKRLEKNNDK